MLDSHIHLNSWNLFPNWQKHISDFEKEWWDRLVNAWSDGEYNEKDVYISVPTIISKAGAKEIVELHLAEDEKIKFKNSCNILKEKCKEFLY